MKDKRRAIVWGSSIMAVSVVIGTIVAFKAPLWEAWYIRLLRDSTEDNDREEILGSLGDIGGEQAFKALLEMVVKHCPMFVFTRELRGVKSPLDVTALSNIASCEAYSRAVGRIRGRLGRQRSLELLLEIVQSESSDLRARVYCSQWCAIALCEDGVLPERLRGAQRPTVGGVEWSLLQQRRDDILSVLIKGLNSEDALCRAGSAFALKLCGPEASIAIPSLRKAISDPDPEVCADAADALARIAEGR